MNLLDRIVNIFKERYILKFAFNTIYSFINETGIN